MPIRLTWLRRLAAFLLPLFVAAGAHAALPTGVTQGPTVEGVTEYRLANGLTVLLFPDASKPKTTVNVTYRVGSAHENYGETGMAHLLEHLVFKGTPSRGSIMTELGRRGMDFNGTTSWDRTNYYESFTASDENLDWAIAMEADRMVNSFIRKSDLDTEMTVVRNEFENGENNPQLVLFGKMLSTAYMWHNYGKLQIGARSDIENVDIARLQAFYRMYYQPDNAVVTVAGKFDPERALALIAKHFGPIPKPARALPRIYTEEPVQDGERTATLRRVGNSKFLGMMFHTVRGAHPDAVAVDVLGDVLTLAPSGRLYKALVETKKATAVQSWNIAGVDPGTLTLFAQIPDGEEIGPAREAMLATIADLAKNPVTEAEVARVRQKAAKNFDQTMASPQAFGVGISEAIALGDWRLFFLERDRYRSVQPADVQRVARDYLKRSNLTIGEFLPDPKPDRAPAPPPVDVAALVKDYKGDAAVAAGETFDPTPANLDARAQRFTLPNGMKVALLPKKTRGESVSFNLTLRFGDEKSVHGKAATGALAGGMLTRGTTKRSRQDIEDGFDKLRAKVGVSGTQTGASASGQTYRAQLADVLKLTAEVLREPSFPGSEFEQLKRQRATRFEAARTEPQDIATRALARHANPYPPGDPRYAPTVEESIAGNNAVTLDDVKQFHAQFYGASNAELAVVGDFDADATRALVTELFGGWKSPVAYTRVPDPFRANVPAALKLVVPDKANAFLLGVTRMPVDDMSPDYPALLVANFILGDSSSARVPERLRQKDGLSYAAGTFFQPSSLDQNSAVGAYAIFAPENLERVRTGLAEELSGAVKSGFTDAEVKAAKEGVMQERRLARTEDGRIAGALASQLYLGRTFATSGAVDAAIEKLTTQDVNAVLRKYVRPGDFAFAFAGTFK
ncbi:MAG: insulinase family protein [Betaproteobacteria bacterium]|nr:insulinase family protein [Betaproteobacteria bacterium]